MPTSRPMQTSGKLGEILTYYSDVDDLKGEMEGWRDNIPDSLQSSDKYSQVDETADTLGSAHGELEEACDRIIKLLENIPKKENEVGILDMPIVYTERKMYKGYSMPRWVRLSNPCAALGAVVQYIEDHMEDISKDLAADCIEELKSLIKQVESAIEDLGNVDFPSMFG